jgi:tetratricopeptide (TPR) repeat protein
MIRVFLSYARGDDERFVRRLYEGLRDARGPSDSLFDVWFDRVSMPSRALTFHQEIRDAINACERLILVVGPRAVASDYVTQEWQFAYFAVNEIVNPIIRLDGRGARGKRVDGYSLIPEDLRLLHAEDFRDDAQFGLHLDNLIRQLSEPVPPVGKLVAVPELPPSYRAQPERLNALRDLLLPDLQKPVVVTGAAARVGLQGMGGIGKSVLANALAHHPQIRRAFQDGIYWITLGQQPRIEVLQGQLAVALGGNGRFDRDTGKEQLRELMADRAALLILDDVWERDHAERFNITGARGRILLTTRDSGLVAALADRQNHYRVELPAYTDARAILGGAAEVPPDQFPPEAETIIEECGRLPLAMALCGSMVQGGSAWSSVLEALRDHDLEYLSSEHPAEEQHQNAWKAMDISLRVLPVEEQRRYAELAVFDPDTGAPDAAVATLWQYTGGLSARQTDALLAKLTRRSLLQRPSAADGRAAARVSLHSLLHHFAAGMAVRQFSSVAALHQQLLDAYWDQCADGWPSGPRDGYFFENLSHHLHQSGQYDQLRGLLSRSWMNAQLAAANSYRNFDRDIATIVEAATAETRRDVGTIVKGSLVSSSIRSLSTNLPPAVIGAIAMIGDTVGALGYAALISNKPQRIQSYLRIREAILPIQNPSERQSLLEQVEQALIRDRVTDFSSQDRARRATDIRSPATQSERSLVGRLRDEGPDQDVIERAMLLVELSSAFAERGKFELALEAADRIGGEEEAREQVTRGLSPEQAGYMAMELGSAMMRIEGTLREQKMLAYTAAIAAIVRTASNASLQAALRTARLFGDHDQINMLRKIAYALLDRPLDDAPPESYKERALAAMAIALADAGRVSEAREITQQISDQGVAASAKRGIAGALARQGNLPAAADEVVAIPAAEGRHIVRALRDLRMLSNDYDGDLRKRLFQHACRIDDVRLRCEAIAVCSVLFTACGDVAGMKSALDHAETIPWESDKAELLAALAQGFALLQHPDGLKRIVGQLDEIADPWAKQHTLTGLAQAFAKTNDVPALNALLTEVRRLERAETTPLIAVSRAFLEVGHFEGIRDALAIAMENADSFSRAESIGGPRLVLHYRDSSIHELYSVGESWWGIARCAVKAGLTQEAAESLEAVRSIGDQWPRDVGLTGVLVATSALQDEEWTNRSLSLLSEIHYAGGQAEVLVRMSEAAAFVGKASHLARYLAAAERMRDPSARAQAIGAICTAMSAIGDGAGVERCLQAVERYTSEAAKADAIEGALPVLVRSADSAGLTRMAEAATSVGYEPPRCRVLAAVARAMEQAGMSSQAEAVAQQASKTAKAFRGHDDLWSSIAEILSHCETTGLLRIALRAAGRMSDANKIAEIIGRISTKAARTPDLFAETRRVLQSISQSYAYVNALTAMSGSLRTPANRERLTDLWIAAFQRSMTGTRSDTFSTIEGGAESIASLDAGESLVRIAETIRETEAWWSIA